MYIIFQSYVKRERERKSKRERNRESFTSYFFLLLYFLKPLNSFVLFSEIISYFDYCFL